MAAEQEIPTFSDAEVEGLMKWTMCELLTPQITAALEAMRRTLSAELEKQANHAPNSVEVVSDIRLLRFLRASKFKVAEACTQYSEALSWRQANNIDAIRDEIVNTNKDFSDIEHLATVSKYWFFNPVVGLTKTKGPVLIERTGQTDLNGLLNESGLDMEQLKKMHITYQEWRILTLDRISKETGELARWLEVRDLEGAGMHLADKAGIDFVREMSKITTTYYPEQVFKVFIINSPSAFEVLFNIIKPMIPERSRHKVNITSSLEDASKALQEEVNVSELPKYLGGEKEDSCIPQKPPAAA